MSPFRRLPLAFCHRRNVIVADCCLAQHERQINKNTISLPALPMTRVSSKPIRADRRIIKASFQGALSHPCRKNLMQINNGKDIIIKTNIRSNYFGKIDALAGIQDNSYSDLLDNSSFGIVARGDALFSYRLLETLSRGAIPIIISDGWILPFDRTIDWSSCSLRFHQEAINEIPFVVDKIEKRHLINLQSKCIENYNKIFTSIESIMGTMLNEAIELYKNNMNSLNN